MSIIKTYKTEHDEWITAHLEDATYNELAMRFNAEFGMNVSGVALRHRAGRLGLNKTLNRSHVMHGELLRKNWLLPIGTERIVGGVVLVKVDDVRGGYRRASPHGCKSGGCWRKKAYINWENEYGGVPESKRLIYLDGDSLNCDINNLYFADIRVQMHVARQGYLTGNRELTLAAIKWYELFYALKEL